MKRLQDKVAIVTGAGGGLGAATARLFADHGATVFACDVLEQPRQDLGPNVTYCKLDVTEQANWQDVIGRILRDHGRIDILVNNAGIAVLKPIVELTLEDFERVVSVNMTGQFLGIKHVGSPMMQAGKGSIINISSSAGLQGNNGMGAYAASKFGVRGMSKVAALEMGLSGVRVNTVFPGPTLTHLTNPNGLAADAFAEHQLSRRQPIQRFADPLEVANVCLFLASDEASYVTGAEIAADGGMTIGFYMNSFGGRPEHPTN